MSQSHESSTLYESNSCPMSSTLNQDSLLQTSSFPNEHRKDSLSSFTRGRSYGNTHSIGNKSNKHNSMISHVVQGSPKHFTISNKLNESFEDNSTHYRNSSFSNSNGGGSFISRSGNGRILSENNLSPLCYKFSDLSGYGGFSNSLNYGYYLNASHSSISSFNENGEMNNSLLNAKDCLDKDESLLDSNMFDSLVDDLHTLNLNSIKDYYMKIITNFQNDDDFSQFFNENQFSEENICKKQQITQQSLSQVQNPTSNANNLNETHLAASTVDQNDFQTIDTVQDFDNSSQNLKVGSAMSSLIFQINPQKHFRNTMILTFDYFMTPLTFLLYVIKCYYIPTPIGMSDRENEKFEKRLEQIRINIGQVIRDYVELRSAEFLQNNITSVLLIVFFQTIPTNSKEKNLFSQLSEKVKEKKTQYELENVQKRNKNSSTINSIINNSMFNNNSSYTQSLVHAPNQKNSIYPIIGNQSAIPTGPSYNSLTVNENDLLRMCRKNQQIQRQLAIYDPSPLIHYPKEIISKVMAQIDAKWFIRLNLNNLMNSKINIRSKSHYIQKYSTRFNYYVYWFMNQVLNQKSIDMRVNQIIQYIEIMCYVDQEYHSYPSMHALYTVVSYMKMQLPQTWQRLEDKLRSQRKWMSITLELQRYQQMFNDKYYGYKQEILRLAENRQNYIPCMNPYFQDIYNDEMKFQAPSIKKNSSSKQLIVPRVIHERIGDRLLNLSVLQKQCQKAYPNLDSEYKDFRNYKNDESQLYTLFKKKCIKEIDDIILQQNIQFKDLELYFIGKCKQVEPN